MSVLLLCASHCFVCYASNLMQVEARSHQSVSQSVRLMVPQNICLTSSSLGRGQHTGMTSTPPADRLKLVITDEISNRAAAKCLISLSINLWIIFAISCIKRNVKNPHRNFPEPGATPPYCLSISACSVRNPTNLTGHLCHQQYIAVAPSALILCELNQQWSYSAIYTDCQSQRILQWQLWVPSARTWAASVLMYV